MASHSPSDQMFERMDQTSFACVPRDLVESLIEARKCGNTIRVAELTREIGECAIDDIT